MENQIGKYYFKFKKIDGKDYIFDPIRKKYVVFTPEEKVRQYCVSYLTEELKYPSNFIKIESGLTHNNLNKRSDILVYNREFLPSMLVECKSEKIKLSDKALDQLSFYNQAVQHVKFLVITNGITTYPFQFNSEQRSYKLIDQIPAFDLL